MMSTVKILDDFEPYNDIWYMGCFYHAFFPIVTHFKKDIKAILCNNVFAYDYYPENSITDLKLKSVTNLSNKEFLDNLGIGVNTKSKSNNIIDDLIASVEGNRPIIILIDCYYESIRPDAFKKNHFPHLLLIYGYSLTEKVFHIIEHQYSESLIFEKRTICFEDVINCYNGYHENFKKSDDSPTFFEYFQNMFSNNLTISQPLQYKEIYINNYINNKDRINSGLYCLNLFIEDAKKVFINRSALEQYTDDLFDAINRIFLLKDVQRYNDLKLLKCDNDFLTIDNILVNNWNFIRGIIAKNKFSKKYSLSSFEKCIEKLNGIYTLEKLYCKNITSYQIGGNADE